ncbi:hypothetical protein Cgig2_011096 [Carnegiea gigantea]|uniref:Uncharacterized protein n=1 Tax=Carnegiea gigantea TaxID=171969 RepID=A0A9Q1GU17_9CARY|nr:hypothetical protein Cgig2_011096 [Carnegiea gigantea]
MGSSNTGGRDDSGNAAGSDSSNGGLPDSNSTLYSEGEKVLAYHGPRIYEAKIQKAEIRKKEWRYFVHYLVSMNLLRFLLKIGNKVNYLTIRAHVSNSWDEWVGADRLMKYTDDNIQKQQALEKKQGADKNHKSGRSTQAKPKGSTGQPPPASKY